MPTIGPMEIAVVLVIALLILGPKKLPDAGRSVGTAMREFRDSIRGGGGERGGADDPALERRGDAA